MAVGQGEFVALTGYSGSGKSTLLHVLGGLLKSDGGSVFVYDKNISEMTEKELTVFLVKSSNGIRKNAVGTDKLEKSS